MIADEEEYGWIEISEFVTDGYEEWLMTQRYLYYSPEQARSLFDQHLIDEGLRLA